MKTKLSIILNLTTIILLTFYGCKKYEDGPAFSLASKKSRVVNTWKVEKIFEVESGFNYNRSDETLEFKRDGSYIWSNGSSSAEKGTWEFTSDKDNIIMTEVGSSIGDSYKIIKLKSKELWFQQKFISSTVEFHFVKK